MIRAVLDTNVFLRALINPHSRCGRLLDEFADDYELVLSPVTPKTTNFWPVPGLPGPNIW